MQKIGYRLNIRERTCESFNLSEPFRPVEVPPEAKFLGSFYVGSSAAPGAGILVDTWGGQTERGEVLILLTAGLSHSYLFLMAVSLGRYSGTWTNVGCLPVTDAYVSAQTGVAVAE